MKKSITLLGAVGLVLAISSGAFAAKGLLTGSDVQDRSLTGLDIKQHSLGVDLLTPAAKRSFEGFRGPVGGRGASGDAGARGSEGPAGPAGKNAVAGATGADGADGTDGMGGTNGVDGTNGTNGAAGSNGTAGTNGTNGTNGANGTNGTVTPLAATAGATILPTASPPTVVVSLAIPAAGRYVVLAKTQLYQAGAGDAVECVLKADGTVIDQAAMKTLPALAEVPVSLQAVVTVAANTQLSVECDVRTASGTASFNSLIAIPTS
jgi:hypothetical protein